MVRLLFLLALLVVAAPQAGAGEPAETPLWPEIEPFETGYLEVSDMHEIYYELVGNPDGKPVIGEYDEDEFHAHSVLLAPDGMTAWVSHWDAGTILLDLKDQVTFSEIIGIERIAAYCGKEP